LKGKSDRMAKKALWFLVVCILASIALSSCAKPESNEVYFIHAVGFDGHEKGVKMSVVLESAEKNKGKDAASDEYFSVSFSGESLSETVSKLLSEYKRCYTGTAQMYFFSESLSRRALYDVALFVPSSPVFPSQSEAVALSSVTAEKVFNNIKNDEDMKKIKKLVNEDKVNVVGFFAGCTSPDSTVSLPALTLDENEIVSDPKVFYRNGARTQTLHLY